MTTNYYIVLKFMRDNLHSFGDTAVKICRMTDTPPSHPLPFLFNGCL